VRNGVALDLTLRRPERGRCGSRGVWDADGTRGDLQHADGGRPLLTTKTGNFMGARGLEPTGQRRQLLTYRKGTRWVSKWTGFERAKVAARGSQEWQTVGG